MVINKLQETDSGKYKCIGRSEKFKTLSHSIEINILPSECWHSNLVSYLLADETSFLTFQGKVFVAMECLCACLSQTSVLHSDTCVMGWQTVMMEQMNPKKFAVTWSS